MLLRGAYNSSVQDSGTLIFFSACLQLVEFFQERLVIDSRPNMRLDIPKLAVPPENPRAHDNIATIDRAR